MTLITKADGTQEAFAPQKLHTSLRRAGASTEEIDTITKEIESTLHEGMSTQEIYHHAFELLRASEAPVRARYSLRRALFGLGPTGFPFEDFLARLFATEGYETRTRVILAGRCVPYELDVAAFREDHAFVAEAKFHARPGIKSDLQVVLYCYARQLDLKGVKICSADNCGITETLLVTNTKFTSTAEQYAECVGLALLSWDYPTHNNLHDRIQRAGIYPISVLQTLSMSQKRALIERNVIVCQDLVNKPQLLRYAHISTSKTEAVLSEARQLCREPEKLL